MARPKTVCIAGAGPSGLAAAKALLHRHLTAGPSSGASGQGGRGPSFEVTVYDAQRRVGGLWPAGRTDDAGLVHPDMVANQSRHTVQFSDLAWDRADEVEGGDEGGDPLLEFPRAWMVGRYLDRYRRRYLDGAEEGLPKAEFRLGWGIEKAELLTDGTWTVTAKQTPGAEPGGAADRTGDGKGSDYETRMFDYLLVATGFFGDPIVPDFVKKSAGVSIPVIHSSAYRNLGSLGIGEQSTGSRRSILVVGGQMSGVEISSTIAGHLSSAANSPGPSLVPDIGEYTIRHVVQRPVWVIPLFTKAGSNSASFMPVDLPSYDLNRRPKPLTNTQGHITTDVAKIFNSIYKGVVGTDQSEFSPSLSMADSNENLPYLALSDHYMNFVRSGLIRISTGYVTSLSDDGAAISPAPSSPPDSTAAPTTVADDIAAVVFATGFTPSRSLSFLPASVLATLSYSAAPLARATATSIPLLLDFHNTLHRAVPTLGFVGFYLSPYWGVVEGQARLLAALWAGDDAAAARIEKALEADDSRARMRALRTDPRRSQFVMGDYPWLMAQFGAALGLEMSPAPQDLAAGAEPPQPLMDILTPARYSLAPAHCPDAARSLASTARVAGLCLTTPRFAARAVFRSLLGPWRLDRRIDSRLASVHPGGRFAGGAEFLLREGTADGREALTRRRAKEEGGAEGWWGLSEYQYVEKGEFNADNGLKFQATRRYVWRYDERADVLGVWFAKVGDDKRADYLFHELDFDIPANNGGTGEVVQGKEGECVWRATSGHLCVDDYYDVAYEFRFRAIELVEWSIGYTVKGPKKDYTIKGVYRR